MKAMEFIDSVVPRGGTYYVVGIKNKKLTLQKTAKTLEEVRTLISESVKSGNNTYFALGSFKDDSARKQENVLEMKSFFIDLDCGDPAKVEKKTGYDTKEEAFAALDKFISDTGLPQPFLVDSGGGWHAYWVLDTAIPVDKWQPIANKFKQLCIKSELYIDPAVTADSARVLRVPNTPNVSRNVKCAIHSEHMEILSLTQFESPLRDACTAAGLNPIFELPKSAKFEMDEATKALLGNRAANFTKIARKSLEGTGCAQIRECIVNSASLNEPQWRAILSVAQVCEDRDTVIHKISQKHPEYSPDATEKKANETKGPYKCETFENNWPTLCQGCPHKGQIVGPIQLGTVTVYAKSNEVVVPPQAEEPQAGEDSQPAEQKQPTTIVFPKLPFPYERGANGGIYQRVKLEDGTESSELIYNNDLFVMKRIKDPNDGEVLLLNLILPRDGIQEFTIPLKHIGSLDKLRDHLGHHGVAAGKKKMERIMGYILAANEELQHKLKLELSRTQFGWHDKDSVFVIGKRQITAHGVTASPPSTQTIHLAPYLEPQGSYEEWKSVMRVLGRPGWEKHQIAALAAFGAPLMKLSGERGLTINLISDGSGTGKTLAQHFINSVYGSTEHLILRKGDTVASRMHRFGIMCNLPITMDEMTNITPEDVSDLLYSFSEGRGKNRLESGANKERVNTTWWASINVMSSNASMSDKLTFKKATADAELMRLFEMEIAQPEQLDPDFAQGLKVILENNHGIAGDIYLKAVMRDFKAVKSLFGKVKAKVNKMLGTRAKERFWVAGFTGLLTGGYIAKQLGIIEWDVDHLFKYLISLALSQREQVNSELLDYNSVLGEFISDNKGAILQINGNLDLRSGLPQAPIFNPNIKVLCRFEPDTKTLYVVRSAFKEYCVRRQISYNTTMAHLASKLKKNVPEKIRIMRGTGIDAPSVHVLTFEGDFGDITPPIQTDV